MNLLVLATAMLGASSAPAAALPREYRVDFGESIVEFSIAYSFSRVKGRFVEGNGTILYDEAHPENSSVTILFDAASLNTASPLRDRHLKTSDFFDVEKYPTVVFQSEQLVQSGDHLTMYGKLTMHGVTRDVSMPLRFPRGAPSRAPLSNWLTLNAESSIRLARADFGIVGGGVFNAGFTKARLALIADSVDVSIELEAYSPDAVSDHSGRVQQFLDSSRTLGGQWFVDRLAEVKRTRPPAEQAAYLSGGDLVARGMLTTERVADAVKVARAVTELFPQEPRPYAVYGLALARSRDARGAAQQYARMKEVFRPPVVDPNEKYRFEDPNWWYLNQLVRIAVDAGWTQEAVPLARALAEMYTGNARTHVSLGVALTAAGDASGAAAAFAQALSADPRESSAMVWRRRLPAQ
jgi:polyisoprenoid-binding protein YceI